uniref:ShKT domain-containing protein n=1 Tax=Heterorhabditis bacteriophora TaxID=37862 RepID=A0A1I7WSJ0_HETBA
MPPQQWNGPTCRDFETSCATWAINDQCTANPQYMNENCKVSCGQCSLLNTSNRLAACGYSTFFRQVLTGISVVNNLFMSTSLEKPPIRGKNTETKRGKFLTRNCGIPAQNGSYRGQEYKARTNTHLNPARYKGKTLILTPYEL